MTAPPPPPPAIPSVPSGLTAVASNGSVALTWTANAAADAITHYNVYRTDQASGAPWSTTTVTTLTDTSGIVNGTQYCYRVSATSTAGASAESAAVCATPSAPPPSGSAAPATPTALAAVPGNARVTLTWAANPAGQQVSHYNVYRIGQKYVGPWASPTAPTFTNLGEVVNGTRYCYQVSATNATGDSAKSPAVCATPRLRRSRASGPAGLMAVARNGRVALRSCRSGRSAGTSRQRVSHRSAVRRAVGLAARSHGCGPARGRGKHQVRLSGKGHQRGRRLRQEPGGVSTPRRPSA